MPTVQSPAVLKAVYLEASKLIRQHAIPTEILGPPRRVFHYFDRTYIRRTASGDFARLAANEAALVVRDSKGQNRFSGPAGIAGVPDCGALYCSTQQQAQINEILHYSRNSGAFPDPQIALQQKCIAQIQIRGVIAAADLSAHNPGSRRFLERLGSATAVQDALRAAGRPSRFLGDHMADGDDCSVARGIGLAVASCEYLNALQATTVRRSERSDEEMGDNIVFFGREGQVVPNLWVEKAYVFSPSGPPIVLAVA